MIRLCSAFPADWPADRQERLAAAVVEHWPSVQLRAEPFDGGVDQARLTLPAAASGDLADGDIVAWLDPDVEPVSSIPSYVIPQLLKDAALCFIASDLEEVDLAFWAVRLDDQTRRFLTRLAAEAPPARQAFDAALAGLVIKARDLTPGGSGDVWGHGPLGRYTRRMDRPT